MKKILLAFVILANIVLVGVIIAVVVVREGTQRVSEEAPFVHPDGGFGKPVIYLYPEQEMDVRVDVEPIGGMTYSDPVYGNGWNVRATPAGAMLNYGDGKTYPYLFWEGFGENYESPEFFWVVEREQVSEFLDTTLGRYGLVDREITDFKEFWVPRMQDAQYYKVGFHETAYMDLMAPLEVSPRPDSVLRILMDFEELDRPIVEKTPLEIPVFGRNGFTVVEWGGVLR